MDGRDYSFTYSYALNDALTSVRYPSGRIITYSLDGVVRTTSAAGNAREMTVDGLGRLVEVVELDGAARISTRYQYNSADDLTWACQNGTGTVSECFGGQKREFTYSTLGLLISAKQPETSQLPTTYTYHRNGLLKTRTDANGRTVTFAYDVLNRMTGKTYSDSTPSVVYAYDDSNVPYSKGRLTRVSSSVSTFDVLAYDSLGRILRSQQTTGGRVYPFEGPSNSAGYSYDLTNAVTGMYLPSGRLVNTTFSGRGLPVAVIGTMAGVQILYGSAAGYNAAGLLNLLLLGGEVAEATSYNSQLQFGTRTASLVSTGTQVFSLENRYGVFENGAVSTAKNNGSVAQQMLQFPGETLTQTYLYDGLNRLKDAKETRGGVVQWGQEYSYDHYGNRWVSGASGSALLANDWFAEPTAQGSFEGATNRLTAPNGYDSSGNLTTAAAVAGGSTVSLTYDAEHRLTRSANSLREVLYDYDGDGRRVRRRSRALPAGPWTETVYVYDAFGMLAAEYSSEEPPAIGSTEYRVEDHLGNTRLMVNGAVLKRFDYTPFGRELMAGGVRTVAAGYSPAPGPPSVKFTGKERDAETGLDYFGARYMSAAQGRFTSPDPFSILQDASSREELDAYLSDPQHWNKYAYSLNNPLKFVDPDGRHPVLQQLLQAAQRAGPAAQRYAQQAGQTAQRYGQQAYLWAAQFFNSPTGQEATAAAAEVVTGAQLPFGFANVGQFQQFGKTVSSGLREVAGEGVQAFLGGSAVTGKSFANGAAFDVGRTSDFDVAVVGGNLLAKAKELGIELRGKGTRTGPLGAQALKALGLDKLAQKLSQQAGRPVNFMIYESEEALRQRGAPYQGLQ